MEEGDDASCQTERQRYYYPLKLPSTGYKPGDVCVDASLEKIDVIEHIERHHMAHSQRREILGSIWKINPSAIFTSGSPIPPKAEYAITVSV